MLGDPLSGNLPDRGAHIKPKLQGEENEKDPDRSNIPVAIAS